MEMNLSTERNYGIDLLKIVAMLMIVAGHVLLSGGPNDAVVTSSLRGTAIYYTEVIAKPLLVAV